MWQTFIDHKARLFQVLQIGGWLGYGAVNFLTGVIRGLTVEYARPTVVYVIAGFIITLGMRQIFKSMWAKPTLLVIVIALTVTVFAAAVFSFFQVWAYINLYPGEWRPHSFWEYFVEAPFSGYVFMSWTGLYFGINYYLKLQQQTASTLRATALAQQAQLKMLRYQLNPHFLFNTLNAISTLVLTKDTENADKMLTRLSSFLRYSLVNEPTQRVCLDQEIQALNLYLDIEKARFGRRLRIAFDVDPRARAAKIPSLLLQPIVENAIKYAIASNEHGGTLRFSAHVKDSQLFLAVADDGPGISLTARGAMRAEAKSSGVGLANTRARLKQLYGRHQSLKVQNVEPHGLCVTIRMPAEFSPKGGKSDRP